jgi:hypothetical protein
VLPLADKMVLGQQLIALIAARIGCKGSVNIH